ncbi:C40 family peptidase [Streptomyces sp. NPDC048254]|uniref:C40 family peptidase n=1 Tax=Streptomyces sp. NPDC048254 TaxID=3365525 RepID=UPI00371A8C83
MKALAAGIGVVFLSPILIAGAGMMLASAADAVQSSGSLSSCLSDIDSDQVAERVAKILDGASGKDVHVEGLDLPAEQIPNAATIVATGLSLDVPTKGQIIALATAMQESRLRNLNYGDRDSLGLFQQRPSQGWGSAQQIRDPVYASAQFYQHLLKVDGWQQMTVTQAAQAVQKSALPNAYAQWENLATALQAAIAKTFPGGGNATDGKDADQTQQTASDTSGCTASEDGSGFGRIPEGSVPKGYKIPADTDPKARKAIIWAMQQLGTLYQWGGSCTNAHGPDPMGRCDCSSLMQQAYAHAGVPLTRTTYTQVNEGKAVSPARLEPGDLIFSRGTASRPEHVGMYMGEGLVIEAPRTTKPVRITPIKDWTILAARRVL